MQIISVIPFVRIGNIYEQLGVRLINILQSKKPNRFAYILTL